MNFPVRVSVTTFNVWGENYWPQRSASLSQTFHSLKSDVYLLQEVTPEILEYLDKSVGHNYKRVHDDRFAGWQRESNIYWNDNLLALLDHGHGDLHIEDHPARGLFWARLAVRSTMDKLNVNGSPVEPLTIFCSTAHFPWEGNDTEMRTGINQRIPAATNVCEQLRRLVPPHECSVFAGDLNDDFHPVRILGEEMGLMDVFECMDLPPPITHPVRPSCPREEMRPNRTIDWILCSLPAPCRVVSALAKGVRGGMHGGMAPSDHLPVMAVFELSRQQPFENCSSSGEADSNNTNINSSDTTSFFG